MPTTYTNGLKLPDLGSIDWYNAYKNNIDILDPIVGTVNGVATTYAPISHNHDASEITSGTIDIARLPPAALERLTTVADQTARYALTTSTVQLGDTVKQLDTGIMYLVVDTTKLNSADGYVEYSAGTASKAIADEDGTSIKSGYVNVAGNQTVTGQKTWSALNGFTKGIWLDGAREAYIFPENAASYSGLVFTTPSYTQSFKFGDWQTSNNDVSFNSNNAYLSISAGFYSTDSKNKINIEPRKADESTLGSSSYQWSSVYAQSYYYNGTAWGLDQTNTWSEENSFNSNTNFGSNVMITGDRLRLYDKNDQISVIPSSSITKNIYFTDKNGTAIAYFSFQHRSDSSEPFRTCWRQQKHNGTNNYYSINFNNLGKFYPETTDISLGTSTNQWSSVYAQTYYYNGTAWGLDKANVWTNANHFTGGNYNNSVMLVNSTLDLSQGNPSVSETNQSMICLVDSSKQRVYSRFQSWTAANQTVTVIGSTYKPDANSETDFSVWVSNKPNDTTLHPYGVTNPNLGNSTYKWKTLNGINPGALSLPDVSKSVTVDIPVDWVTDGSAWNDLNVSNMGDGWLCLTYRLCGANDYILARLGGTNANTYPSMPFPAILLKDSKYYIYAFLPVTKAMGNIYLEINLTSGSVVVNHSFYPCLGNV